jgi:enamine deaminase RidA (YjgF/YER057c/UK114 family)
MRILGVVSSVILGSVVLGLLPAISSAQQLLTRIESDPNTGRSLAVAVGPTALAHTAQLLPLDRDERVVGRNATEQCHALVDQLAVLLADVRSDLNHVVKLNIVAASDSVVDEIEHVLAKQFSAQNQPAVCYVVGALPLPEALVALDAVATTPMTSAPLPITRLRNPSLALLSSTATHIAILPQGRKLYVSGDAKPGDMFKATADTMASLAATLKHFGMTPASVVQLKCFLQPISAAPMVQQEIARFFGSEPLPPLVFVEWTMSGPIEIELIAAVPPSALGATRAETETVDYFTPPGVQASAVFSRVACMVSPRSIYISGMYGREPGTGEDQVHDIYAQLKTILHQTGSDARHLVKATYYVTDDDASQKLNVLRAEYYDRDRPPAASKAAVRAVGEPRRTVTLDMIAVPSR